MCYDTAQLAERIYRDAVRAGASEEELEYLKRNWEEKKRGQSESKYYHVSGFDHPNLLAFHKENGLLDLDYFTWGLIPHWVKDEHQATELWSKTINARGETMLEKPAFKEAAAHHRIVIPLDGFYEHHHKFGKTFPHYIQQENKECMLVGGIASAWVNPNTGERIKSMSIVTTRGNTLMEQIHNNPKLKEPRMPLVLEEKDIDTWFEGQLMEIKDLIHPSRVALTAHTVRRLRGRHALGNVPEVSTAFHYTEMDDPLTLF
jgi:putative SOS response-associated peptidase YedK